MVVAIIPINLTQRFGARLRRKKFIVTISPCIIASFTSNSLWDLPMAVASGASE